MLDRDLTSEEAEKCEAELFNAWIEQEKYADLVAHVQEEYDVDGGHVEIVSFANALVKRGEVGHLHALFHGLIATRCGGFWRNWPEAEAGKIGRMRQAARFYAGAMEVMCE